tara:strand:+ start:667 stop:1212 length:546 start_codon:yes stop_codon:yes gene_type:complete
MNLSGLHRKFVLNGRDTMDPTKVTGPTQLLSLGYLWQSVPGIDTDGTSTANANQGHQTWIYIKAGEDLAAGTVVGRSLGVGLMSSDYIGYKSMIAGPATGVFGVAQYEILSGEYGFILREGITETLILNGALTDGLAIITSDGAGNAGKAEVWSAGAGVSASVIGYCLDQANTVYRVNCVG